MAKSRRLPPVHPGEVLREDLMAPLGLSINGLSRDLRVPVTRMSEIVNGRRSITADTALRLARYFAMTPQFWMNLQAAYDLDVATRALADRSNGTCIRARLRRVLPARGSSGGSPEDDSRAPRRRVPAAIREPPDGPAPVHPRLCQRVGSWRAVAQPARHLPGAMPERTASVP